jgi:hypothetical protein
LLDWRGNKGGRRKGQLVGWCWRRASAWRSEVSRRPFDERGGAGRGRTGWVGRGRYSARRAGRTEQSRGEQSREEGLGAPPAARSPQLRDERLPHCTSLLCTLGRLPYSTVWAGKGRDNTIICIRIHNGHRCSSWRLPTSTLIRAVVCCTDSRLQLLVVASPSRRMQQLT